MIFATKSSLATNQDKFMTTQESLVKLLAKIAKAQWDSKTQPVLLSNLPPLLAGDAPDYKDFLAGKSLKQFIKETEGNAGNQYTLIEHPTQRAKLAILPTGVTYDFPEALTTSEPTTANDRSSEKALVDFLKALKKLPPQDISDVHIPVSVLVKMMK